jgi:hypothetical protein
VTAPAESREKTEPVTLYLDWALMGKHPGGTDRRILASNDGPFSREEFNRILRSVMPGNPVRDTDRVRPDSLPWATVSHARLPSGGTALGMAIHEWSDSRDATGRPIIMTRFFCVPFVDLAARPVSYHDLYTALATQTDLTRRTDTGRIAVDVRPYQPDLATAAITDAESACRAALVAVAAMRGPVAILGAPAALRAPGRLAFLDACLAFLAYGQRATLVASTWADSDAKHQVQVAFTGRRRPGDVAVPWNGDAVAAARAWMTDHADDPAAAKYLGYLVETFASHPPGGAVALAKDLARILGKLPRHARAAAAADDVYQAVKQAYPSYAISALAHLQAPTEVDLRPAFTLAPAVGEAPASAQIDAARPADWAAVMVRLIGLEKPEPGTVDLAAGAWERRRAAGLLDGKSQRAVVDAIVEVGSSELWRKMSNPQRLPRMLNFAAKLGVTDEVLDRLLASPTRKVAAEAWERAATVILERAKKRWRDGDAGDGSTTADEIVLARMTKSPRIAYEVLRQALAGPEGADVLEAWVARLDSSLDGHYVMAPFMQVRAGQHPDVRPVVDVDPRYLLDILRYAVRLDERATTAGNPRTDRALRAVLEAVRQLGVSIIPPRDRPGWAALLSALPPLSPEFSRDRRSQALLTAVVDRAGTPASHRPVAGSPLRAESPPRAVTPTALATLHALRTPGDDLAGAWARALTHGVPVDLVTDAAAPRIDPAMPPGDLYQLLLRVDSAVWAWVEHRASTSGRGEAVPWTDGAILPGMVSELRRWVLPNPAAFDAWVCRDTTFDLWSLGSILLGAASRTRIQSLDVDVAIRDLERIATRTAPPVDPAATSIVFDRGTPPHRRPDYGLLLIRTNPAIHDHELVVPIVEAVARSQRTGKIDEAWRNTHLRAVVEQQPEDMLWLLVAVEVATWHRLQRAIEGGEAAAARLDWVRHQSVAGRLAQEIAGGALGMPAAERFMESAIRRIPPTIRLLVRVLGVVAESADSHSRSTLEKVHAELRESVASKRSRLSWLRR